MSTISFTRYIDITSGVGGVGQAQQRQYIGRYFTINNLLPPQSFIEFTSATQVSAYFGSSSEEYARAVFYFGWVSKLATSPSKLSFARWVETAVAPMIFGNVQSQLLATFTAITNGSFEMTIGGTPAVFTALDFSAAASLADVAGIIQTAIRTQSGTMWTAATVTFDNTRGSFDFVGGSAITAVITVSVGGGGTDVLSHLGWLAGAIVANGSAAESLTTCLSNSYSASNNFGTVVFLPTLNTAQATEVATWVNSLNVTVRYDIPVTLSNYASYVTVLSQLSGTAATVSMMGQEYPEQFPGMIWAATNYNNANSTQNYEFQQANLTPSVSDDTTADTLDAAGVNYYGVTQQAGTQIAFYQTGAIFGTSTSPLKMNLFANEVWLKDAIGVAIMNLILALPEISADIQGQTQITSTIQTVINQALFNGVISVGKILNNTQKQFITTVTGNDQAWYQVQNIGYYLTVFITQSGSDYFANYILVYSKDDTISKVIGSDILI